MNALIVRAGRIGTKGEAEMQIFKSYIAAQDRDIERRREHTEKLHTEYLRRVEQYRKDNAEFFASDKCQAQLHPSPERLEWDSDRPAPQISDTEWDSNQADAEGWGNQV